MSRYRTKQVCRYALMLLLSLCLLLGTGLPVRAQTSQVPDSQGAQPGSKGMTGASPSGQLTITIEQPYRATVIAPGTPVPVAGTVRSGGGTGGGGGGGTDGGSVAMNVIYVIDVSGSTSGFGGACGDRNGDGFADTILDCEIAGLTALNTSLGTANVDVSLVSFSSSAEIHDVSPVSGHQTKTQPSTDADGNGTPDVVEALESQQSGGGSNYDSAFAQVQGLLVAGERNFVIFISGGNPDFGSFTTGPGSPLQAVADAGATVLTFAVGTGTTGCAAGEPLSAIAEATGGTCTEVTDPSQLSAALTGTNPTGVNRVEIEVNGIVGLAMLDPSGRFSYLIPPNLLRPGRNDITVRAYGADELAGQVAMAETFVVRRGGPPGGR